MSSFITLHLICLFLAKRQEISFKEIDTFQKSDGFLERQHPRVATSYFFEAGSLTESGTHGLDCTSSPTEPRDPPVSSSISELGLHACYPAQLLI